MLVSDIHKNWTGKYCTRHYKENIIIRIGHSYLEKNDYSIHGHIIR